MRAAIILAVTWVAILVTAAVLSGCAQQQPIFTPVQVEMPIATPCKVATIAKPDDLLAALPKDAKLTDGMKAALAQHEYDVGYQGQLEAAISGCNAQ